MEEGSRLKLLSFGAPAFLLASNPKLSGMKKNQMLRKIVYPERELGAGSMSILQMWPSQVLHCVSELFRTRVTSEAQSLPEDRQISMASRTWYWPGTIAT